MSIKTKRVLTAVLAGVIVLAMMLSVVTPVLADELDVLQQEQQELEEQAANAEALKNATAEELAQAQADVDAVKAEMNALDEQINEVGNRIIDLNNKIAENETKLEEKEAELAQAQEDLKVYYEALKDRIQIMYESDRSSYLEVLLNASSISEFFSKLEYINQMVEYDNQIMEELDACRQVIQESKEAIETTKQELESDKAEEQQQQDQLLAAQADKQSTLSGLESNQLALSLMAQEQEAAHANLLAAISENQTAIANEEARIAEEEQIRQEQEQQQQEEAASGGSETGSGNSDTGSGSSDGGSDYDNGSSGGGSTDSGSDDVYDPGSAPSGGSESDRVLPNGYWSTWPGIGNGMLSWPVDSYTLTSLYGPRIHPITGNYSNHGGIDFAASYGQSIYSCGDGVVVEANSTDSWGGGWGYYVVIQHTNGLSTLYAHCSSLNVTAGQTVSAGQVIAYVGSTGQSTGSHLHLEVYSGGVRVNPEDYL